MFEPTQIMTAVKTKTVTRTQMAVALTCLGASIIAAAAMSIAAAPSNVCLSNAKINVALTLGQSELVSACAGQLIVPTPKFNQLLVRSYNDNTLTLIVDKKSAVLKVGEGYKLIGKSQWGVPGYQQNLYVEYSGKVDKKADIVLHYGLPSGEKGVYCSDNDESQKNYDGSSIKDFQFINPYVKGVSSFYNEFNDEMVDVEDNCTVYDYGYLGSGPVTTTGQFVEGLNEYYCSTANGGEQQMEFITCEGGCVDGACVYVAPPKVGTMDMVSGGKLATNKLKMGENEVAKLSFTAANEDVLVNQLIFTFDPAGNFKQEHVQGVILKDSVGNVVAGPALLKQDGAKYKVILQNQSMFTLSSAMNEPQNYSLYAAVDNPALLYDSTSGFRVSINPQKDIAAVGAKTQSTIKPVNKELLAWQTMYGTAGQGAEMVTSTTAILEVSSSTAYVGTKLFTSGATTGFLSLTLSNPSSEKIEVTDMAFTKVVGTPYFSYLDLNDLWVEDEVGNVISGSVDWNEYSYGVSVKINSGKLVVDGNSKKVINLKGKVNSDVPWPASRSGHAVGFKLAQGEEQKIIGKSLSSGLYAKIVAKYAPGSQGVKYPAYIFKAYPVLTKKVVASNKLSNGTKDLFQFQVQAVGGDVSLYKFTFNVQPYGTKVSDLYLYDITDYNEKALNSTAGEVVSVGAYYYKDWTTDGNDWKTSYPGGEVVVAENKPRTFVLRGVVSGATNGASVSTKLLGNCDFYGNPEYKKSSSMGTAAEVDSFCSSYVTDFIWSDRSAINHSLSSKDWTTGGGVVIPYNGTQLETVAY